MAICIHKGHNTASPVSDTIARVNSFYDETVFMLHFITDNTVENSIVYNFKSTLWLLM